MGQLPQGREAAPESAVAMQSSFSAHQTLAAFLRRFRFASPRDRDGGGFGPVHCAAVAGNLEVLRQLVPT